MFGCKIKLSVFLLLALSVCTTTRAEQRALTPEELEQKEKLRQTVLLPFKYITDFGAENGELNMLQIRPLYTISSKHWNFIIALSFPLSILTV